MQQRNSLGNVEKVRRDSLVLNSIVFFYLECKWRYCATIFVEIINTLTFLTVFTEHSLAL